MVTTLAKKNVGEGSRTLLDAFRERLQEYAFYGYLAHYQGLAISDELWKEIEVSEKGFNGEITIKGREGTLTVTYTLYAIRYFELFYKVHRYVFLPMSKSEYKERFMGKEHTEKTAGELIILQNNARTYRGKHEADPVNPPTYYWEDQPEMYSYEAAKKQDPRMKKSLGRLLMKKVFDGYQLVGIVQDGFKRIHEVIYRHYNGATEFYAEAVHYFFPQEIRRFLGVSKNLDAITSIKNPKYFWGDQGGDKLGLLESLHHSEGDNIPLEYYLKADCTTTKATCVWVHCFFSYDPKDHDLVHAKMFPEGWKDWPWGHGVRKWKFEVSLR